MIALGTEVAENMLRFVSIPPDMKPLSNGTLCIADRRNYCVSFTGRNLAATALLGTTRAEAGLDYAKWMLSD